MLRGRRAVAGLWRACALAMVVIWRGRPGVLMAGYLILTVAARQVAVTAHLTLHQAGLDTSGVILAFFCWRVWRGGRFSRRILIIPASLAFAVAAFHLAQWWDGPVIGLMAIGLAQLALLFSPAVYARTRREATAGPGDGPAPPQTQLRLRLRPAMLLAAGLLAGLALTLLLLLRVRYLQPPGCGIPQGARPPVPCSGFGRGYPLPVLASSDGRGVAGWTGFVKDAAQWTVLGLCVMYLFWLVAQNAAAPEPPAVAARPATVPGH